MDIYKVKCKKCGYEVDVKVGQTMIEANWGLFTETATFICPKCHRTINKKVILGKHNLIKSMLYHLNSNDPNITIEKIKGNLKKALEYASNQAMCPTCKCYMYKFTKKRLEKKVCPICGGEIEAYVYIHAD